MMNDEGGGEANAARRLRHSSSYLLLAPLSLPCLGICP